ncbi:MAG: hypothetical protein LBO62_03610 [Endomicrobium sp.]|jgi:hypothetical protein|nr:hypothetical protein [Endomicrobium sp.]
MTATKKIPRLKTSPSSASFAKGELTAKTTADAERDPKRDPERDPETSSG